MPGSRAQEIIDEWRAVTRVPSLPERAPRPSRRPVQVGVGATALAAGALVLVLLLGTVSLSPGSTGKPESPMPTTPVAIASASPQLTVPPSATPSDPPGAGSCSADQLVLAEATNDWFFTTVGSQKNGVSQPFSNRGGACLLVLSNSIFVARSSGAPIPVEVMVVGKNSYSLAVGDTGSIELTATWSTGDVIPGQTPGPCEGSIEGVRSVEVPVASGRLLINLGTVWREVCSSPASVTITVKN